MNKLIVLWIALVSAALPAQAELKIVTTTTDIAALAEILGGDAVDVKSLAKGYQDPHYLEAKPSNMRQLRNADLLAYVGLELEVGWLPLVLDGSRNPDLRSGELGHLALGEGIDVLEVPTGEVSRSDGDVHPLGNPHYWLDPRNAATVAQDVAEALAHVDPDHAQQYYDNADAFAARANALAEEGAAELAKLPVKTILCYHASWIYFTTAFGLETAAHVEPVPGIPPTGRHLQELLDVIKERGIKVLIQEPYFSKDAGEFLQRGTDIVPVTLSPSCDDVTPQSYFDHIQNALDAIVAATRGA